MAEHSPRQRGTQQMLSGKEGDPLVFIHPKNRKVQTANIGQLGIFSDLRDTRLQGASSRQEMVLRKPSVHLPEDTRLRVSALLSSALLPIIHWLGTCPSSGSG